jgi:hypothetical protein
MTASASGPTVVRLALAVLIPATLVILFGLLLRSLIPVPMSACQFLIVLKREALHCNARIAATELSLTRLDCAIRRAQRVANALGHSEPANADRLIGLFTLLDAAVREGSIDPAAATRALENAAEVPGCLTGPRPAAEASPS